MYWPDANPAYAKGCINLVSPWPGHHRGQRQCPPSRLCSSATVKGTLEREKLMELMFWKGADEGCCGLFPCPAWGWAAAGALLGQRDWPQPWPSFGLELLLEVSALPLLQSSPTTSCVNESRSCALLPRVRSPACCLHLLPPAVATGISMWRNQEGLFSSPAPEASSARNRKSRLKDWFDPYKHAL